MPSDGSPTDANLSGVVTTDTLAALSLISATGQLDVDRTIFLGGLDWQAGFSVLTPSKIESV